MTNACRRGSKFLWLGEGGFSPPLRPILRWKRRKARDQSKFPEQFRPSAHLGAALHFCVRPRGFPAASKRLGQISDGVMPNSRAMMDSIAGQGRFRAFPAAVG